MLTLISCQFGSFEGPFAEHAGTLRLYVATIVHIALFTVRMCTFQLPMLLAPS